MERHFRNDPSVELWVDMWNMAAKISVGPSGPVSDAQVFGKLSKIDDLEMKRRRNALESLVFIVTIHVKH